MVMFISIEDPITFEEAEGDDKWLKVKESKLELIERNKIW